MSAGAVLAIDQGTSGTKAIVVDPSEGVVGSAEVALHPSYLPGGGVEQDPQAMLDSILEAGREALGNAPCAVDTVALANQGETVIAWDPHTGRPLSPAIVWQDGRASEVCDELGAHRDMLAARTGLVLDPYFSAPKMTWLRRHMTREGVVSTTDAWLVHQLTGEFVSDVSTASRSMLIDLDRGQWDERLLEIFGLADERLPRIVDCDEAIGSTTSFGASMVVGGLIVDQQGALLAQGCWAPGEAKCTFGTGAFLLANTGARAVRSAARLTSSVAWRTHGTSVYCIDGQILAVASAVRWLVDLGLISHARDLDQIEGEETHGVLCVPALAGLAAPWWRPDATGAFTGMTLATRPEHLIIAVLHGLAAQVAELTDVIGRDVGDALSVLRVDGGLTQSRALMQAVADIAQLPVALYPSPHATALGVAALGRMAQDPSLTMDQAVLDWNPRTTYEPRWTRDRALAFRSRWRQATATMLPPREEP